MLDTHAVAQSESDGNDIRDRERTMRTTLTAAATLAVLLAAGPAEGQVTCTFTDDPIVAGETPIRAEHINEIRDCLKRLLTGGTSAPSIGLRELADIVATLSTRPAGGRGHGDLDGTRRRRRGSGPEGRDETRQRRPANLRTHPGPPRPRAGVPGAKNPEAPALPLNRAPPAGERTARVPGPATAE